VCVLNSSRLLTGESNRHARPPEFRVIMRNAPLGERVAASAEGSALVTVTSCHTADQP